MRVMETTLELANVKIGEVLFQELPEEPVVLSASNPIDFNTPVEEISRIVGEFLKGVGIKGAAANGSVLKRSSSVSGTIIISQISCSAEWMARGSQKTWRALCGDV
ncbi:hypothetical protein BsIDN1_36190 [Bacillus safensis]|uniref:Uncharacterized protein n=1 Tax=Bacillus safensis TaxID=561879 RepID=A0A5S9MAS6_BACIA|nr:hypothetical protein BsIDN1_36190 [Bacillus safensis]